MRNGGQLQEVLLDTLSREYVGGRQQLIDKCSSRGGHPLLPVSLTNSPMNGPAQPSHQYVGAYTAMIKVVAKNERHVVLQSALHPDQRVLQLRVRPPAIRLPAAGVTRARPAGSVHQHPKRGDGPTRLVAPLPYEARQGPEEIAKPPSNSRTRARGILMTNSSRVCEVLTDPLDCSQPPHL